MKAAIRKILLPEPNFWWTVGGAIPILWNATHWKKGPHFSGLASRHPLATSILLLAYGYHFGIHKSLKREREFLEEVAAAASGGSGSVGSTGHSG